MANDRLCLLCIIMVSVYLSSSVLGINRRSPDRTEENYRLRQQMVAVQRAFAREKQRRIRVESAQIILTDRVADALKQFDDFRKTIENKVKISLENKVEINQFDDFRKEMENKVEISHTKMSESMCETVRIAVQTGLCCGVPPSLPNAVVVTNGTVAKYSRYPYKTVLNGESVTTIQCQKNGHWETPSFTFKECFFDAAPKYSGRLNTTVSGLACQRWDTDEPHTKNGLSSDIINFPDASLDEASNYCRAIFKPHYIWCFTMDPNTRLELCDIPQCEEVANYIDCIADPRRTYTGHVNITKSGKVCQRWDSDKPHKKNSFSSKIANYPDASWEEASNYCRVLDDSYAGCYTTDPHRRWEPCDVPDALLCNDRFEPIDCKSLFDNGHVTDGVYTINGDGGYPFDAYCNMTGGGWTVIQRRQPLGYQATFNRPWADYVAGFGDLSAEHWLGLEYIHRLTKAPSELMYHIENPTMSLDANYPTFVVHDASTLYKLHVGDGMYSDGTPDRENTDTATLTYHNGMPFSTFDAPNGPCTEDCYIISPQDGGWWYNCCWRVHINGDNYIASNKQDLTDYYRLTSASLKIRRTRSHMHA